MLAPIVSVYPEPTARVPEPVMPDTDDVRV
jgi:hypothetical protein